MTIRRLQYRPDGHFRPKIAIVGHCWGWIVLFRPLGDLYWPLKSLNQCDMVTTHQISQRLVQIPNKMLKWEFQPVAISPLAETGSKTCTGRSHQKKPWNLSYISSRMGSKIFSHKNPGTFSKFSFSQSLAETSVEKKYGPEDSRIFF